MYPPMAEKASMLPGWATGVAKHLGLLGEDKKDGKEETKQAPLTEGGVKAEQTAQPGKEL